MCKRTPIDYLYKFKRLGYGYAYFENDLVKSQIRHRNYDDFLMIIKSELQEFFYSNIRQRD